MVKVGTPRRTGRLFEDLAVVVFLLAQASDGVLTYLVVAIAPWVTILYLL